MKCRIKMSPDREKFDRTVYVVEYRDFLRWHNVHHKHNELLRFFDLNEYHQRSHSDYWSPSREYLKQDMAEKALNNFCKLYFKKQQLELQDKIVKVINTKDQGFIENL